MNTHITFRHTQPMTDDERIAAAAPEMLAALKTVMSEADFGDESLAAQCRAAIAKAEGHA